MRRLQRMPKATSAAARPVRRVGGSTRRSSYDAQGSRIEFSRMGGLMNCYGGKNLAASFRTVRRNTLKIAQEIPEDKYRLQADAGNEVGGAAADAHRPRASLPGAGPQESKDGRRWKDSHSRRSCRGWAPRSSSHAPRRRSLTCSRARGKPGRRFLTICRMSFLPRK